MFVTEPKTKKKMEGKQSIKEKTSSLHAERGKVEESIAAERNATKLRDEENPEHLKI